MEVKPTPDIVQPIYRLLMPVGAALLLFSLLFNLFVVWRNIQLQRETQRKAIRLQQIETQVQDWQMFFQDLTAYSARQPAIDPILQRYGLKAAGPPAKSR